MRTDFGSEDPASFQRPLLALLRPFMKTPASGATTSIHLASAPERDRVTGQFFVNSKPKRSSPQSYDEPAATRLWHVSTELTGVARTPT